jgi:hypothetical protein
MKTILGKERADHIAAQRKKAQAILAQTATKLASQLSYYEVFDLMIGAIEDRAKCDVAEIRRRSADVTANCGNAVNICEDRQMTPTEALKLVAKLRKLGPEDREMPNHYLRRLTLERYEAARAIEALARSLAEGPKVRALVWDDRGYEWSWWAGDYQIRCEGGIGYLVDYQGVTIGEPHDLEEDAKAAAEADHAARILAQLEGQA